MRKILLLCMFKILDTYKDLQTYDVVVTLYKVMRWCKRKIMLSEELRFTLMNNTLVYVEY